MLIENEVYNEHIREYMEEVLIKDGMDELEAKRLVESCTNQEVEDFLSLLPITGLTYLRGGTGKTSNL